MRFRIHLLQRGRAVVVSVGRQAHKYALVVLHLKYRLPLAFPEDGEYPESQPERRRLERTSNPIESWYILSRPGMLAENINTSQRDTARTFVPVARLIFYETPHRASAKCTA